MFFFEGRQRAATERSASAQMKAPSNIKFVLAADLIEINHGSPLS